MKIRMGGFLLPSVTAPPAEIERGFAGQNPNFYLAFFFMFVDEVKVFASAGKGGRGCVAFHREAYRPKGGPSGGNGGRGGNVLLQGDHDLNNLVAQYYSPQLIAQNGNMGLGKGMDGQAGKDLIVKVPCGTLVWRLPRFCSHA